MNSTRTHALAKNWPFIFFRGLLTIQFGALVLAWPDGDHSVLAYLFGAFAVLDATLALIAGLRSGPVVRRWWLVLTGLTGLTAGALAFLFGDDGPLLMLIGLWAVARGALEVIGAMRVRRELGYPWLLLLSGTISILVGTFVVTRPGPAALDMRWTIISYALLVGVVTVGFSLQLRKHALLDFERSP